MDPVIGGLLAGGGSAIASMFNTSQNNANSQEMQQQAEAYNTQMSNTAYQRASADMKAAGLNPMMMAAGGMSASTPTIQPAQKQSSLGGVGGAIQQGVSTAVAAKTMDKMTDEIANLQTENMLMRGPKRDLLYAQGSEATQGAGLKNRQAFLTDAERNRVDVDTQKAKTLMPVSVNEALTSSNEMQMNSALRKGLDVTARGARSVDQIVDPVTNVISSARGAQRIRHEHLDYNN